jgi:hypothetical protein
MYDKVIGLVLFLATVAFPLAADETAAAHENGQSIVVAHNEIPDPGDEGPNK